MKKHMKKRYGGLALLLAVVIALSAFLTVPFTARAATVTKTEKTYDIAVVFDNSGSMYQVRPKDGLDGAAWCRAKYAIEIFASMLNYERDKLHIFPMWEVTTDGSQPASGGSYSPIEITSKKDIDKISNMFTVHPSNTPFEPIQEAHDYLSRSSADEKWLIILTDGVFNLETRDGELTGVDLENKLHKMASKDIKIQYLGFGGATALSGNESKNFYAQKTTDSSLKDDLIAVCNTIFQRSILPENRLNGEKLNLDLSMKNLIVFAQGADAKIISLKDSSGNEIPVTMDSGQRKFSEVKANGYEDAKVDESLAGQVVTFAACPKGEYTLSYSGVDPDKIQIFYEPDVDIDVSLINSDGVEVDNPDDFIAGEYTVSSKIVDAATDEDVSSHELMGDGVELKTYVKTSKDGEYKEFANGSNIVFDADDGTELYFEGRYLEKYTISSKNDPDLSWMNGFVVQPPGVAFKLDAELLQPGAWFTISEHDAWKPVKVTMTLDGQPLTDAQMAATELKVTAPDGITARKEILPGESAYNLYIAQDENGNYVEPPTGKHELKVSATYVDEYGEEARSNTDTVSFEVQTYAKFWRILLWVIIFIVLFLIWLAFMLQKVLPKKIDKDTASFITLSSGQLEASMVEVQYRRKGKTLTIAGSSAVPFNEQCSVTFDIRAVDNRFTKPKGRRIMIVGIDSPCEELKIAGTKYVKYMDQWIKATDLRKAEAKNEFVPIEHTVNPSPRYELSREDGITTLICKTKTIS